MKINAHGGNEASLGRSYSSLLAVLAVLLCLNTAQAGITSDNNTQASGTFCPLETEQHQIEKKEISDMQTQGILKKAAEYPHTQNQQRTGTTTNRSLTEKLVIQTNMTTGEALSESRSVAPPDGKLFWLFMNACRHGDTKTVKKHLLQYPNLLSQIITWKLKEESGDRKRVQAGYLSVWVASKNGYGALVKTLMKNWTIDPISLAEWAAQFNKLAVINMLAKQGVVNLNKYYQGETLLYFTAKHGYVLATKALLNHNMDVNKGNDNNHSPLMIAVEKEHGEVMKILIDAGADYFHLLSTVAKDGYIMEVYNLIKAGVNPTELVLDWARSGDIQTIKILLDAEANIHAALFKAKRMQDKELLNNLIIACKTTGFDTSFALKPDDNGEGMLISAAKNDESHVVKALIEAGADIDRALKITKRKGDSQALQVLTKAYLESRGEITTGFFFSPWSKNSSPVYTHETYY